MTVDIRDARFYVVDERIGSAQNQTEPLEFDTAIAQAERLVAEGAQIQVLYTEEATQTEITRFVSQGIRTALVSGG